jgi:hypothetical protein
MMIDDGTFMIHSDNVCQYSVEKKPNYKTGYFFVPFFAINWDAESSSHHFRRCKKAHIVRWQKGLCSKSRSCEERDS